MEGAPIDIVIFAPLAPIIGLILFWFIQLIFIESEKFLLEKIRPKHEPLCRFTNFLGILFQNINHALGYTVTKSGISDFYISINYGKVAPKREKKGIYEWISNGFLFVGPFFIPAFLLLFALFFMLNDAFVIKTPTEFLDIKYTFAGQFSSFAASLHSFSTKFFGFLFNLDLLHPAHFGFIFFMIFLGIGMRPSYIGQEKPEKIDMLYDLKNIWDHIRHQPLYIVLIFLVCYIFFYISFFLDQNWYVALFSVFGWVSIISIVALIIGNSILLLIRTTDLIDGRKSLIPYLVMPSSYIMMRVILFYIPIDSINTISLITMILATALVTYLLIRPKTNKFKTKRDIKKSKKKEKRKEKKNKKIKKRDKKKGKDETDE
jgi:hypothetical protein